MLCLDCAKGNNVPNFSFALNYFDVNGHRIQNYPITMGEDYDIMYLQVVMLLKPVKPLHYITIHFHDGSTYYVKNEINGVGGRVTH